MLENAIARRYAQAFFTLANEQNNLEKLEEEFTEVIQIIKANPNLKKIADHQLISPDNKKDIFNNLFSGKVSETLANFLNFLIDKYRINILTEIYDEFIAMVNNIRNVQNAEVTSAKDISNDDLEKIKNKLTAVCGKEVHLTSKVDASLKGGIVVRLGDKIIDGSAVSRLEKIKSLLTNIS